MKVDDTNITFDEKLISDLILEIRKEQTISPKQQDSIFINDLKEGMYNINGYVGCMIDYNTELEAKSLLKNYVLYANYKRLAEFKELYMSDYVSLQLKYNRDTSI